MNISTLVPNPQDLLSLEVEEVAGVLLEVLNQEYPNDQTPNSNGDQPHRHNFFNSLNHQPPYPTAERATKERVALALMEAWSWLERENFLVWQAGFHGTETYFITRRGRRVGSRIGMESYKNANLLPRSKLHPAIADKIYPAFLRGAYDTAVFQAFR